MVSVRCLFVIVLLTCSIGAQTARLESQPPQYREVTLQDITRNPVSFSGQRVTLTAEILSLSADSRSLDLYDELSRAVISVSLVNLKKSDRRALLHAPIHRVAVSGRINLERGQPLIEAERVEARSTERLARR
ncbi:MAG: hypothetical protein ABI882_08790 [Acidobacteriota bacterium]